MMEMFHNKGTSYGTARVFHNSERVMQQSSMSPSAIWIYTRMPFSKTFNYPPPSSPMRLITKWFGVFLVYGEEIKAFTLFPDKPEEIAERLYRIRNGEILDEERSLSEGNPMVGERRLSSIGRYRPQKRMVDIDPAKYGFRKETLHEALLVLGKKMVRNSGSYSDDIIQTVSAIDEIIDAQNTLSARYREWYGYHDPFDEKSKKEVMKESPALASLDAALSSLESSRNALEGELARSMEERFPNLTALVGASIGARLISLAGGMERLSVMPSSTIQVLGAENAFFKYLRDGKGMPKHGIIYQHPLIHGAKPGDRGKISRFMAGKIKIAVALDVNRGEFMGDELLESVRARAKELKERPAKRNKKRAGKRNKRKKKRK